MNKNKNWCLEPGSSAAISLYVRGFTHYFSHYGKYFNFNKKAIKTAYKLRKLSGNHYLVGIRGAGFEPGFSGDFFDAYRNISKENRLRNKNS